MTALPDPTQFRSTPSNLTPKTAQLMRPNVIEHYWGYAISSNEHVIDLPVLLRGVAGVVTLASFVGAVGVWLLPAIAFSGDAVVIKAMSSILLTCIGAMLMSFVARGTRVRVQIDTATGEISEVVDGLFGKDVVLARYGMDAIENVEVVASKVDPAFGQIQISVKGAGLIAAGDGDIVALGGLRDRLACDCGLEHGAAARDAIWSGPRAA